MVEPDFPFRTDGCSGHVYHVVTFGRSAPWGGCCVEHDRAYWRGGSAAQRLAADRALRDCVSARGHPFIAAAMYYAVRAGGHPLMPSPWRWGYGWLRRGYRDV